MGSPSFTIAEIFATGCDDVAVEDAPKDEAEALADANFAANAEALAASQAELRGESKAWKSRSNSSSAAMAF